jgi:hypothetical protein
MKIILSILTIIFSHSSLQAQLKHYFSYNTVLYADFMNHETDEVDLAQSLTNLCISYKAEKKKLGAEANYSLISRFYHPLQYPDIQPGEISGILLRTLGVAIHYNVLDNKRIKLNPLAGLTYQWYDADVLEFWGGYPPIFPESVLRRENEKKIGIVLGGNINIPIYKGIYTNGNIRYTVMPTADFNKQNLITEIGLGYMLQRRVDKKQDK